MFGQIQILKKTAVPVAVMLAIVMGAATATTGQTTPKTTVVPKAKTKPLIDLNKATAAELEENLKGVGAVTARKIVDGRPYTSIDDLAKVGVPARTIEEIRPYVTVVPPPAAKATTPAKGKAAEPAKVNLNTATVQELEGLPGIGPVIAKEIIAGRPYKTVDDLDKIRGLGKSRIERLRGLVVTTAELEAASPAPATKPATTKGGTVAAKTSTSGPTPAKPININTASKEALDELPGIGPVKAQAIIDFRASTPFKTKEDVMKVKGIKEVEFSKIKELITVD